MIEKAANERWAKLTPQEQRERLAASQARLAERIAKALALSLKSKGGPK